MDNDNYDSSDIENDEIDDEEEQDTSSQNDDSTNNSNNYYCGDFPGGFQTINPEIFDIIAEVLGNVLSGQMPFNIQNAVGNWIQLVGQAIETYSSQQGYFQSGPGRMYSPQYYNVTNPFCPNDGENQDSSGSSDADDDGSTVSQKQINELSSVIEDLRSEVGRINTRLEKIENKKS